MIFFLKKKVGTGRSNHRLQIKNSKTTESLCDSRYSKTDAKIRNKFSICKLFNFFLCNLRQINSIKIIYPSLKIKGRIYKY